jgi:hypothetical protein
MTCADTTERVTDQSEAKPAECPGLLVARPEGDSWSPDLQNKNFWRDTSEIMHAVTASHCCRSRDIIHIAFVSSGSPFPNFLFLRKAFRDL